MRRKSFSQMVRVVFPLTSSLWLLLGYPAHEGARVICRSLFRETLGGRTETSVWERLISFNNISPTSHTFGVFRELQLHRPFLLNIMHYVFFKGKENVLIVRQILCWSDSSDIKDLLGLRILWLIKSIFSSVAWITQRQRSIEDFQVWSVLYLILHLMQSMFKAVLLHAMHCMSCF